MLESVSSTWMRSTAHIRSLNGDPQLDAAISQLHLIEFRFFLKAKKFQISLNSHQTQ